MRGWLLRMLQAPNRWPTWAQVLFIFGCSGAGAALGLLLSR